LANLNARELERDLLALWKKPREVRGELFPPCYSTALDSKVRPHGSITLRPRTQSGEVFAAAARGRLPVDAGFFEVLLATSMRSAEAGHRAPNSEIAGGQLEGAIPVWQWDAGTRGSPAFASVEAGSLPGMRRRKWSGVVRVCRTRSLCSAGGRTADAHGPPRSEARGKAAEAAPGDDGARPQRTSSRRTPHARYEAR